VSTPGAPPPRSSRSGTRRAGRGDLSPRRVPPTIIEPTEADDAIVIRRLTDDDRAAVTRLAQLEESAPAPDGELLGAESDGRLVAAISLTTGAGVADPFTRTQEVQEMLRLRLSHLRRRDPVLRNGRPRRPTAGVRSRET
jgi:hypothetical protein